eukprot:TRINITY_DN2839_c0_g1_i1.p1 TRINITY_DN2839_c0_g1~~TRINITY_DN2839_c0_g1_i1.p1  ORF type:complete len:1159 (+),score=418.86 TRINITY_DN2839_c0_g1_i1:76-3552(+)
MAGRSEKAAVRVMTRVRPFNARELGMNPAEYPTSVVGMADGRQVQLCNQDGSVKEVFDFHETFWSIPEAQKQFSAQPFADQVDVYGSTGRVAVEQALKGYHCCIFAYGQTGSGKTYTMLGTPENPGIAPRLVDELFESVEGLSNKSKKKGFEYNIGISFYEIYNEKCKDLIETLEGGNSPNLGGRRATLKKRRSQLGSPQHSPKMSLRTSSPKSARNMSPKGSLRGPSPRAHSPKNTTPTSSPGPSRRTSARVLPSPPSGKGRRLSRKDSARERAEKARHEELKERVQDVHIPCAEETESTASDEPKPLKLSKSIRSSSPAGLPPRCKSARRQSHAGTKSTHSSPRSGAAPPHGGKKPSFFRGMPMFEFDDNDADGYHDLRVRHSPVYGVYIDGLTRLDRDSGVATAEDVKRVIRAGLLHRATAETKMNATSSRSHAVFQLSVVAKNYVTGVQRYSHINLVDLAGSERLKMSGAEGERMVEATRINLSLSTLRRVIDILIENSLKKKRDLKAVPPYRESLLTWVLSETLGGNSKTLMLATVSPHASNLEDTGNTLRYAVKAKQIVNNVRVNEEKTSVMLSAMMQEIRTLQEQMEAEVIEKGKFELLQEEVAARQKDVRRLEGDMQAEQDEVVDKQRRLETAMALMHTTEQVTEELKSANVEAEFHAVAQETDELAHTLHADTQKVADYAVKAKAAEQQREEVRMKYTEAAAKRSAVTLSSKATCVGKRLGTEKAIRQVFRLALLQQHRETVRVSLESALASLYRRTLEKRDAANLLELQRIPLEMAVEGVRGQCSEADEAYVTRSLEQQDNVAAATRRAAALEAACGELDVENTALEPRSGALELDLEQVTAAKEREEAATVDAAAAMREKIATARAALTEKQARAAALRKERAEAEEAIAAVEAETASLRASAGLVARDIDGFAAQKAMQREANHVLEKELVGLTQELRDSLQQLARLAAKRDVTAVGHGELKQRHDGLKQAVSNKYFPVQVRGDRHMLSVNPEELLGLDGRLDSSPSLAETEGEGSSAQLMTPVSPALPPYESKDSARGPLGKPPLKNRSGQVSPPPQRLINRPRSNTAQSGGSPAVRTRSPRGKQTTLRSSSPTHVPPRRLGTMLHNASGSPGVSPFRTALSKYSKSPQGAARSVPPPSLPPSSV